MPAANPSVLRRRGVAPARQGERPVATIARDLGISVSCLRRWSGVDAGRKDGTTSADRAELVELRQRNRVLEMEVEIMKRASATTPEENIPPR